MPESTIPMMIPSPALLTPPSCSHSPPAASSPRKAGVEDVSAVRSSSGETARTPAVVAIVLACAAVSFAAKPLYEYT